MIPKKQLQQLLRRVFRTDAGLREPRLFDPVREWGVGLLAAAVVVVLVAGWSGNTYLQNRGVSPEVKTAPAKVIYRAQMVDGAYQLYADYETTRTKIRSTIVTPSAPTTTLMLTATGTVAVDTPTLVATTTTEAALPVELSF